MIVSGILLLQCQRLMVFFYIKKFMNEHSCGVLLANGDSKRLSYNQRLNKNPTLNLVHNAEITHKSKT